MLVFRLGRRAIDLAVLLFAVYAFVFVPLGSRTGLEHVKAIFGTHEAKRAGNDLKSAGGKLLSELSDWSVEQLRGDPDAPKLKPASTAQLDDSNSVPESDSAPARTTSDRSP